MNLDGLGSILGIFSIINLVIIGLVLAWFICIPVFLSKILKELRKMNGTYNPATKNINNIRWN